MVIARLDFFFIFFVTVLFCIYIPLIFVACFTLKTKNMINTQNVTETANIMLALTRSNVDGYTVCFDGEKWFRPTTGFAVGYAETQDCFGQEGAAKVAAFLAENIEALSKRTGFYFFGFGGWTNYENGKYYFDAVAVFHDEQLAAMAAEENKQIAYFDLSTSTTIYTKTKTGQQ